MQVDKVSTGAHDEEHIDNGHGGGAGAIKDGRGDESAGRLGDLAGEEDDGEEREDAVQWHLRHRADNTKEAKRDGPEERQLGDHLGDVPGEHGVAIGRPLSCEHLALVREVSEHEHHGAP